MAGPACSDQPAPPARTIGLRCVRGRRSHAERGRSHAYRPSHRDRHVVDDPAGLASSGVRRGPRSGPCSSSSLRGAFRAAQRLWTGPMKASARRRLDDRTADGHVRRLRTQSPRRGAHRGAGEGPGRGRLDPSPRRPTRAGAHVSASASVTGRTPATRGDDRATARPRRLRSPRRRRAPRRPRAVRPPRPCAGPCTTGRSRGPCTGRGPAARRRSGGRLYAGKGLTVPILPEPPLSGSTMGGSTSSRCRHPCRHRFCRHCHPCLCFRYSCSLAFVPMKSGDE